MGRRQRHYQTRRDELIRASWTLFTQRGWDETTVSAIIDSLGIAKGTFYHYFESKNDLLEAAIDQMTRPALDEIQAISRAPDLGPLAKLERFISELWSWRLDRIDAVAQVARVLSRDENSVVRHKMTKRSRALALPELAAVIAEGADQGLFDAPAPQETALLMMLTADALGEVQMRELIEGPDAPETLALIRRRFEVFISALERILGLPEATITRPDEGYLEQVWRAVRGG